MIHFAHANGFPAKTYNKLFSYLKDDFEVGCIERHAHDPKFPVTNNWHHLKDELREEIEKRYDEPIIGMGHSFGGVLHIMLAAEKPELYKSLVLLDSMIISRLSSFVIKTMRNTSWFEKYSPMLATKFRRNKFGSKDEAFEHYSKKEKFAKFDADVLRDYVEHGLIKNEEGFELFIEPKIEAEIYKTIPDHLPKLKNKSKVPTIYIGGTDSQEARLARIGFMKRNFPYRFEFIQGSHLFPFEKPLETSKIIKNFLLNQTL